MTNRDLIAALMQFDQDAEVVATWESIFVDIDVYVAPNGVVVIDADHNFYRRYIESGKLLPPETP